MFEDKSNKSSLNMRKDNIKNGLVEVKNGEIIVSDPSNEGKPARVRPGKNVILYVDNKKVDGPTEVFQDSSIRVEFQNAEPAREFNIHIEEDGMSASVSINYQDGLKYVLKDKPANNFVVLESEVEKKISCPRYTLDEAMDIIREKGIVYGIDKDKLSQAVQKGSSFKTVIASGVSAIDDTDDVIEKRYEDKDSEMVEINGRVDFYSIGKVTSVYPGQLLAEKIPGSDGKTGIDIFGHYLHPKKGKRITLSAGRGAVLSNDGLKVYSQIQGRPEIRGGMVSVNKVFEVSSDVDVSTGNIDFAGDVIVKGNINEGLKVRSGGNVVVMGSVNGGEIECSGDVAVYKNVIAGRIQAGSGDFMRYNIIDIITNIKNYLGDIFYGAAALKDTGKVPKIYKDGQIIKLLIDTKFSDLTGYIKKLRKILSDNVDYIDMRTIQVGAALIKYFLGNGPLLVENLHELQEHIERIDERIADLESQLKQPANIAAAYIQNSVLTTSGSIIINGRGCYNSELTCKKDIVFEKYGSVVRGGSLNAGGNIKIYELGSAGGAHSNVTCGQDSCITCEIAHMNSIIKVGNMSMKISEPVKKLKAYIDKGELMVEKSKLNEGGQTVAVKS